MEDNNLTKKRTSCLIFSRVVGWYSPLHNWNEGKKSEWSDRQVYEIKDNN